MSDYKKRFSTRSLLQDNNTLLTLIFIHLVMFVGFAFVKIIYQFNHTSEQGIILFNVNVLPWFTLSPDPDVILSRPWTILTHMFLHIGFWQILANMLWLWTFGMILQNLAGNRKVIPVFIYGSLAGAIGFILAYNFIPSLKPAISVAATLGASAGIMSVAIAASVLSPDYRIFPMLNGGIPLWILTTIYVVIDLVTIPIGNTGEYIHHLAGAFIGFIFIFFYKRGYDWSGWMNNLFDWIGNLFNPDRPKKGKQFKEELFYKASSSPYSKSANITQQRIDEILDKINQQGYQFLTEEEKELLKRASKEDI